MRLAFWKHPTETRALAQLRAAPEGASKLGPRESVALQLREWALNHHADAPMGTGFKLSTLDAFANETKVPKSEVHEASKLISDGNDATSRLLHWAFQNRRVSGDKNTDLSLSPKHAAKAAIDLDLSLADVERIVAFASDEGKLLASRPGFIRRVQRPIAPVAVEAPPPDWNVIQTTLDASPANMSAGPSATLLARTGALGEPKVLATIDQVAIELRSFALEAGDALLGGTVRLSTLNAFAKASGRDLCDDVQPAAEAIRKKKDFASRVLSWAFGHGHVQGAKSTEIAIQPRHIEQAAGALDASPDDVARAVEYLNAQGNVLASTDGFIRRVPA